MRHTFFIFTLLISCCSFSQVNKSVERTFNPTGTYLLNLVYKVKDGDKYGYFGEIKVKRLTVSSYVMTFYVCKGAPSYNSGSFIDTVHYQGKNIINYTPFDDSTCVLTFKFSPKGVMVYQQAENINFACGFGHGVAANDLFFKKASSKVPVIEDQLTE